DRSGRRQGRNQVIPFPAQLRERGRKFLKIFGLRSRRMGSLSKIRRFSHPLSALSGKKSLTASPHEPEISSGSRAGVLLFP
ncbi:MAG: hypothetical protein ACOYMS_12170, partial [Terrimicrobiaceae bacterium]